MEVKEV